MVDWPDAAVLVYLRLTVIIRFLELLSKYYPDPSADNAPY
jgi:hypothetical protein